MRDRKALNESRKVPDEMFVKLCVSIKTHNRDHLTSACVILWLAHNYNNTVGMGTVILFFTRVLRQFCYDLPKKKCIQYRHMHDVGDLSKFRETVLNQDAPNSIEDLSQKVECLLVSYNVVSNKLNFGSIIAYI